MNGRIHTTLHTLNKLFHTKKPSEMWKLIRKSKTGDGSCNKDIISMDALCNHFSAKFTMISNGRNNDTIRAAKKRVKEKYNSVCTNINDPEVVISEYQIRRYIKQPKCGISPGVDGISAEHLKCAVNTNLPTYLSVLLTLCVRFGLVPDTFLTGVLVPLRKNLTLINVMQQVIGLSIFL